MRHQKTRTESNPTPLISFRAPEDVSDEVYEKYNALAHRQNLQAGDERETNVYVIPKVPTFANRLIRRESFKSAELRQIRDLIQDANAGVY